MKREMNRESLSVDLPRFHAEYATRERILKNVLTPRQKNIQRWLRPALGLTAAVVLILLFVLPQTGPEIDPLSPGHVANQTDLAAAWQAFRTAEGLPETARLLDLTLQVSPDGTEYEMTIAAVQDDQWREFIRDSAGHWHAEGGIANLPPSPPVSVLETIDSLTLLALLPNPREPGTITLDLSVIGQNTFDEPTFLLDPARDEHELSLEQRYIEIYGDYVGLTAQQAEASLNYLVTAEPDSYKLLDLRRLFAVLEERLDVRQVYSFERADGMWRIEALLPQGRSLIWAEGESEFFLTVELPEDKRTKPDAVADIIRADTGLEVVDVGQYDRGLWPVSVLIGGQTHLLQVADYDGTIVWRSSDLFGYSRDGERLWHHDNRRVWVYDQPESQTVYVSQGEISDIQGLGDWLLVEEIRGQELTLTLLDDGEVVERWNLSEPLLQRQQFSEFGVWHLLTYGPKSGDLIWGEEAALEIRGAELWLHTRGQEQLTASFDGDLLAAAWYNSRLAAVAEQTDTGVTVKLISVSSSQSAPYNILSLEADIVRLAEAEGLLVTAVCGDRVEVLHWQQSGSQILSDVQTAYPHVFMDSVEYSGKFLLYRRDTNRSRVELISPEGELIGLSLDAATPVWLDESTLGLVTNRGVERVDVDKLFQ
ncbi:MAG: hypothetical protein FH749_14785 [Firmicutes bacterium]|nr:hypothetical protein [Bacillota bacterium]